MLILAVWTNLWKKNGSIATFLMSRVYNYM